MFDLIGMCRKTFLGFLIFGSMAAAAQTPAPKDEKKDEIVKAPPPAERTYAIWTGFYFGGNGGAAWADFGDTAAAPGSKAKGGFGGFEAGFNYQYGNRVVIGLETDSAWGNLTTSYGVDAFRSEAASVDYFGSARARLGYAMGPLLPFVTAGVAWDSASLGERCLAGAPDGNVCKAKGAYNVSNDAFSVGWTAGGGVEYAFRGNFSLKFEYLHADFGSEDFTFPPASSRAPDQKLDIVRAGLNYRLTHEDEPLK